MLYAPAALKTTIDREDNPKAVFYGTKDTLITPLALYLTERNVDLYSGKDLQDALYGNYFFYVGSAKDVEEFLEKELRHLPRTLLLLTEVTDLIKLEKLAHASDNLKLIILENIDDLTAVQVEQIMGFFLGENGPILKLNGKEKAQVLTPDRDREEVPELNRPLQVLAEDTNVQEVEKQPSSPIDTSEEGKNGPKANETKPTQVASFFKLEPKGPSKTGRLKSPFPWQVISASLVVLLLVLILPLVALGVELLGAGIELREVKTNFNRNNLARLKQNLKGAELFLNLAQRNLLVTEPIFTLIHKANFYRGLSQNVQAGNKFVRGTYYFMLAASDGENLLKGVLGKDKGIAFGQLTSAIKGNLTLADTELALAEAGYKSEASVEFYEGFPGSLIAGQYRSLRHNLTVLRQNVVTARNLMSVLPEMVGVYEPRTYLVVLQNNMELRPTGGFIGSYALVTFEGGVLKNFTVEDVYTADGALKGHVDPPEALRVHLGQEHWYLRDANWDPDFRVTGAKLAWFLSKEIDVAVDGVVAVDLTFAKYLLEATGQIELADYQEKITTENLFAIAQKQVQSDFFPGSTQKRDFLGALGRALIEKLLRDTQTQPAIFAQKIYEALIEKHTLVYLVNVKTQELIDSFGWGGKVENSAVCENENCVKDYLLAVDANVGINKVNYYVARAISDKVSLDGQHIEHVLKINYKNTAPKDEIETNGWYKDYVRIYVPHEYELTQASTNDVPLTLASSSVASTSSVITETQGNFKVFSSYFELGADGEKTLAFTYSRPDPSINTQKGEYVYKIQKQPGTSADSFDLTLSYPPSWQPVSKEVQGEVAGATSLANTSGITYNTPLSHDQTLITSWVRK